MGNRELGMMCSCAFCFFFSSCIYLLPVGLVGEIDGGVEFSFLLGQGLECFLTFLDLNCGDGKLRPCFCSVIVVIPGISCRTGILLIFG